MVSNHIGQAVFSLSEFVQDELTVRYVCIDEHTPKQVYLDKVW